MQQLRADVARKRGRAVVHEPQAEMDVTEQAPFGNRRERRRARELHRPPDVVQERQGEDGLRSILAALHTCGCYRATHSGTQASRSQTRNGPP